MEQEVTVTSVDWNGKSFDGSPFSDNPPWINDNLGKGYIGRVAYEADYAIWAVHTQSGIVIAEPGDKISIDSMFGLTVSKKRNNILTWDAVKPTEEK